MYVLIRWLHAGFFSVKIYLFFYFLQFVEIYCIVNPASAQVYENIFRKFIVRAAIAISPIYSGRIVYIIFFYSFFTPICNTYLYFSPKEATPVPSSCTSIISLLPSLIPSLTSV